MPSLKEIKTRIASVQSTRKITSAMKMVASSKLHHAQTAIEHMLPYEEMLEKMLLSFLASEPEQSSVFGIERPVKKVALIVFSSSSSLCGGFNANVIKAMNRTIEEYMEQGLAKEDIIIYPVGRLVYDNARKNGFTTVYPYPELADKPNSEQARALAEEVTQKWLDGDFDKVEMIYHHFKSAGSQILTKKTYLPLDVFTEVQTADSRDLLAEASAQDSAQAATQTTKRTAISTGDYIVEPDKETILNALLPKLLHHLVFTALLDSNASEHAARMVAMQTATDNADELLSTLNLQYNKSRQAAITNELLDIMGGSVNN